MVYVDAGGLERGGGEEEGFEVAEAGEDGVIWGRRGGGAEGGGGAVDGPDGWECRWKGLRVVVCVCEWVRELVPRGGSRRRR